MDSTVDQLERSDADPAARERDLLAIVGGLARELHPQHSRVDEISLSSRLEKDLGIDSLGRTELVVRLERAFGARLPIPSAIFSSPWDKRAGLDRRLPRYRPHRP
jgi:acyl carrier protein